MDSLECLRQITFSVLNLLPLQIYFSKRIIILNAYPLWSSIISGQVVSAPSGVIFAASSASLGAPGLTMLNYPGEIWLRSRLAQTAAKINSHNWWHQYPSLPKYSTSKLISRLPSEPSRNSSYGFELEGKLQEGLRQEVYRLAFGFRAGEGLDKAQRV